MSNPPEAPDPSHSSGRPLTLAIRDMRPMNRRERHLYPIRDHGRPATRGDCASVPRPCPFVSCRHHLYLDVDPIRGSIKLNMPEIEPDEMIESCSLDVAERGPVTLLAISELWQLTRERVRQLEEMAIRSIRRGRGLEEGDRGWVGWVEDMQGRPLSAAPPPPGPSMDATCRECEEPFRRRHGPQLYCDACREDRASDAEQKAAGPRVMTVRTCEKLCGKCGESYRGLNTSRICPGCRPKPRVKPCRACGADFYPVRNQRYCVECQGLRRARGST